MTLQLKPIESIEECKELIGWAFLNVITGPQAQTFVRECLSALEAQEAMPEPNTYSPFVLKDVQNVKHLMSLHLLATAMLWREIKESRMAIGEYDKTLSPLDEAVGCLLDFGGDYPRDVEGAESPPVEDFPDDHLLATAKWHK